jgi:hypothetical protein
VQEAALSRRRQVNEILIHNPRWGFTNHGSKDIDYVGDAHQLIVYAGPWAEACAASELDGIDDGVAPDVEEVLALLRANPSDWVEYHEAIWGRRASEEEREAVEHACDAKTTPANECPPNPCCESSLRGLRADMKALAKRLEFGTDVEAGAGFIEFGKGHPPLYRVKNRPTPWRRQGWTPDEDEWEQIESLLGGD